MARYARMLTLAALTFMLSGCVAQEKYNALKLERDRYAEQLATAQTEAASAHSQADAYKSQLDALMGQGGSKDALVQNLMSQNNELQRQLDEINRKYNEAMGRVGNGTEALPADLSNALKEFAAQNPDLVEFDPARGVVKFKSDVTFASGQATLTPRSAATIDRLAQILNSSAANGYEIIVAGHTDNTRVVNPATIRAGHLDNWYLSAHRAITVGNELQRERVSPQRIAVTGYADQRPVASNATEAGKAQNRRVEVLILPTTVRTGPVAPATSGGRTRGNAAVRKPAGLNKDTVPAAPTRAPAAQ
jgi:chemotaxis protein MotB